MPRQMIPALLLLTNCLALVPSAKADIFKYDVQLTEGALAAHVIFELSSFQETVDNRKAFDLATWPFGSNPPPTGFSISGDSTACAAGGWMTSTSGPCALFENAGAAFSLGANQAPAFSGPGPYAESSNLFSTTVIITETSAVPEPSALVLLSSCLLGVGMVVRRRRFHQRPEA